MEQSSTSRTPSQEEEEEDCYTPSTSYTPSQEEEEEMNPKKITPMNPKGNHVSDVSRCLNHVYSNKNFRKLRVKVLNDDAVCSELKNNIDELTRRKRQHYLDNGGKIIDLTGDNCIDNGSTLHDKNTRPTCCDCYECRQLIHSCKCDDCVTLAGIINYHLCGEYGSADNYLVRNASSTKCDDYSNVDVKCERTSNCNIVDANNNQQEDCNIVGVNNNQHEKYSYSVFDICISETSDDESIDDISSLNIWRPIRKKRKKSNSSSNDDGNNNVVHEDATKKKKSNSSSSNDNYGQNNVARDISPPLPLQNLQVSDISPSINLVSIIITWYFCCRLVK